MQYLGRSRNRKSDYRSRNYKMAIDMGGWARMNSRWWETVQRSQVQPLNPNKTTQRSCSDQLPNAFRNRLESIFGSRQGGLRGRLD